MRRELKERLIEAERDKRPLRVYCGYDPTSTDLHLGHTITMRKLRQFQELGHEVTFLIGSYTALVGDPSDKNKARPILTHEQVAENARTYAEQAFRVLDKQKTSVRYNGEWLSELSLVDLIRLGQNFTVQQFLDRENFKLRLERGEPIYLHETFYALMQGYDAVAMKTDVQVGGTDQLFNIIVAGRKLQESQGQRPLVGVIMGILPGTDGVQRMSKSTGNIVPINTGAEDMYGKVMSVPDFAMVKYMKLVTRWTPEVIADKEAQLEQRRDPSARSEDGTGARDRQHLLRRRSRAGRRARLRQRLPAARPARRDGRSEDRAADEPDRSADLHAGRQEQERSAPPDRSGRREARRRSDLRRNDDDRSEHAASPASGQAQVCSAHSVIQMTSDE